MPKAVLLLAAMTFAANLSGVAFAAERVVLVEEFTSIG
jgi:hypothetical protein